MSRESHVLDLDAVPLRHPGRWITGAAVVVLLALFVNALASSPNLDWSTTGRYLFADQVLNGLLLTVVLAAIATVLGMLVGLVLASMRLSENPVLRVVSWIYVWVGRAVPPLVYVLFAYNLALLFPTLGVPGFSVDTNTAVTPFVAAAVSLSLAEGAFMAEIIRGGILSVDRGQTEAAQALGMPPRLIFFRIVMPQAMRAIVPSMGNEVVTMLKATSLVSVIAAQELLTKVQGIYTVTYETIELLMVATFWYLVLTSIAMVLQGSLERRYARGIR